MGHEFEIGPARPFDGGVACTVKVPPGLRYLEGHFPGHPIVPGVAQLLPLLLCTAKGLWPDLPAPTGIKRLKFLEALRPGDVLELSLAREPGKLRFEIRRGDVLATLGTLTL